MNIIFVIINVFGGPILNNLFKTKVDDPLDNDRMEPFTGESTYDTK